MTEDERQEAQNEKEFVAQCELKRETSVDRFIGWKPVCPPLSQSLVSACQSCPRKFMFTHRYRLRRKGRPRSRALDIGTFFHKLMGYVFAGRSQDFASREVGKDIEKIIRVAEEQEGPDGLLPGGGTVGDMSSAMERNLAMALVMCTEFFNHYPLHNKWKVVGAERTVQANLDGIASDIRGTIDLELEDAETGEIWIVDHKTVGGDAMTRVAYTGFDLQSLLYRVLAKGLHPDRKIAGVVHNIVAKPTIDFCNKDRDSVWVDKTFKSGPRKGQTVQEKKFEGVPKFENYLERCREWYDLHNDEGSPHIIQSWWRFTGPTVPEELYYQLMQADLRCTREPKLHQFYRRTASCQAYNRLCEFLPLCEGNPKTWPGLIEVGYERAPDKEEHV